MFSAIKDFLVLLIIAILIAWIYKVRKYETDTGLNMMQVIFSSNLPIWSIDMELFGYIVTVLIICATLSLFFWYLSKQLDKKTADKDFVTSKIITAMQIALMNEAGETATNSKGKRHENV